MSHEIPPGGFRSGEDESLRRALSRRAFVGRHCASVGGLALGWLLSREQLGSGALGAAPERVDVQKWRGALPKPHVKPRAKRVIHLYMAGGPSHLETLDEKPALAKLHDQPMPESYTKGRQIAQLQGKPLKAFAPQHPFESFGRSGQRICSKFPHIGSVADDICIINSMRGEQINHDPAHAIFNTGTAIPGRPSMGSWVCYGLGTEADNLPGFVVLSSVGKGGQSQPIAARQWHSGFLPSRFQGVELRSRGDPVLYVNNPAGIDRQRQREAVTAIQALNRVFDERVDDPEIAARIAQYEMAFNMQASVPNLTNISGEPQSVLDLYGTQGNDGSFAANCLMARRLAERGVRFIQVYHRAWDHHGNIKRSIDVTASEVDRATGALIQDLKQRGMLDDTLVLWGGEFGRTPMSQGGSGRDHHIAGYSYFLAGAGVRGGIRHGATDELGYDAVEDVVEVRDLQATILHLLGIDHRRLSFKFQGLDLRLTGVEEAHVLERLLV